MYAVFGFASRDFSLSPHPAKSNAAKTIRNDRVLIRRKSERNKLSSRNRQATWCPVPEIAGILPEVSWLFFKAVRAGLAVKHPYLSHTGRASNAEKRPTGPGPEGCDENGPTAALLVGHVSIQICSLPPPVRLGPPFRRPILIQQYTWYFGDRTLKRPIQSLCQFFICQHDWIRFHTAGFGSVFDKRSTIALGHTVPTQARNSKRLTEFGDPVNRVACAGFFVPGQDGGDSIVAAQSFAIRHTFAQCASVDFHHAGKQRGADRAMRCRKHSANRCRESVHRTETGVSQGESAEHARKRHIFPSSGVVPMLEYPSERPRRPAHALDTKCVSHRIGSN